jgi:hypothetical protein
MTLAKLLPAIIMIESFAAGAIYFYFGDVRHGTYWLAGAILTASVTF